MDRDLLGHRLRLRLRRRRFGRDALIELRIVDKRDGRLRLSGRGIVGQRIHQGGGYDDRQFRNALGDVLGLEELAQDGNVADAGNLGKLIGGAVVEQTGDGEALAALQLDLGLGAAGGDGRNRVSGDVDFVGVVESADFGGDLEVDGAVGEDGGGKVQLDAVGAELNGDRGESAGAALDDRVGEFAAGEEGSFLSADGGDGGFSKDLNDLLG